MSTKAPVKKTKRRLKRSIRRSIAAVLMVTAIGVAAVPVPENFATGTGGTGTGTTITVPNAYNYPESLSPIATNTNLESANPDNDYRAYIITPLSDGTYQLDWQFKFFLTSVEGNDRGIISKYNSTYQQDTVVLDPNVIYEYDKISTDTYNDFYDNEHSIYKVNGKPDLENPDDIFLNEYFNTAYQNYVKDWQTYETKYAQWQKDTTGTVIKPEPPTLSKTPADLSDDQKLKYYCDVNNSPTTRNQSLKGCKLARVIETKQTDPDNPSSDPANVYVYIPQKISGQTPSGMFDDQGFKYTADASIIGIGDKAFMNTKNVYYLTVPKEIKYIGTSAF